MNDWWRGLSPRERRLLGGGGALVLSLALYLLVWEPWQQQRTELRHTVAALHADLIWMRQAAARLPAAQGSTGIGTGAQGVALATLIDRSVRSAGLDSALRRIEPQADGSLQLWLDNAGFSDLLAWLDGLPSGIVLNQLELSRRAGDRVDARLHLQGG